MLTMVGITATYIIRYSLNILFFILSIVTSVLSEFSVSFIAEN